MKFLLQYNAISKHQFGFRPGGSTQEALVSITQFWHQNMEDNCSSLAVFLDLSKAFDSVPHQGVIEALAKAGISGSLLAWFKDYLNNRFQYVTLQGCSSALTCVPSGVPQGSILGPLLFIVLFDSIFHVSLSATSSMIGYADDVTYTMKIKDDEDVIEANKDLMKTCSWITDHGLKTKSEQNYFQEIQTPQTCSLTTRTSTGIR